MNNVCTFMFGFIGKLSTTSFAYLFSLLFTLMCFDEPVYAADNDGACVMRDSVMGRIIPMKQLDVRPNFPGGRDALIDFVDDYFINDSVDGTPTTFFTVGVRFVVEPDGSITGARVISDGKPDVEKRVLSMLAQMPRWSPGRKGGKPVRAGYGARLRVPDCSRKLKKSPEYNGGKAFLYDFLMQEKSKHDIFKYSGERMKVVAGFTVETDGDVADVEIISHGTAEMDSAVLAVVRAMPKWRPGTIDGVPVDMRRTLSFTFGKRADDGKVRVNSEFPGGAELFKKYLEAKMKYPELSGRLNRSGKVVVRFTVEKDGRVTEPDIIRHGTEDMDAEMLRFINAMPRWNPATVDGRSVRQRRSLEVDFNAHETAFTKYDVFDDDEYGYADGEAAPLP